MKKIEWGNKECGVEGCGGQNVPGQPSLSDN